MGKQAEQGAIFQNEAKAQQLTRLDVEESQSIQRIIQISKTHDKTWKQEIRILAQIKEKKLILNGQESLISNISTEITNLFREQGIKIAPWVCDYLDSKYKDPSKMHGRPSDDGNDAIIIPDAPLTTNSHFIQTLRTFPHIMSMLPATEIAEICSLGETIKSKSEQRAYAEHITLLPSNSSSLIDQTNESKQDNQEHLTTDKPVPHGTLMYKACLDASKQWKDIADRVFEFPIEILNQDRAIADGIKTLHSLMDPALDLKYSKNWLDWFRTEQLRDIYGKHAAGVMSFSVTNLCAACSDEKTREWVRMEPVCEQAYSSYRCLQCDYQIDTVCPSCNLTMKEVDKPGIKWECPECNSRTPMLRDLTREQVGDKSSIVMEKAIEVLEHIPTLVSWCAWYRDWIELRVAGRKERLSDELSEKA